MSTTLFTYRLRLRPLEFSDKANLLRLDTNPNVMRYLGTVKTEEESLAYLQKALELSEGKTGYWVAEIEESRTFIGLFVLKQLEYTNEIELGFRLLEEFWNKGFATEGATELIHYCMQVLQIPKIVAVTVPDNFASKHVLYKLGFEYKQSGIYYGIFAEYFSISKTITTNLTL